VRTAVPYSAIDPATEHLAVEEQAAAPELGDGTQIWRITHDGTVSHSVAFEGFDVQILERARRESEPRPPDPGELGWKDTVRVDPLESVTIAVRPVLSPAPFLLPASQRALDITSPLGAEGAFTQLDALTAAPLQPPVVNTMADFSFEARWSIHLVGGEESHTVRPIVLQGTAAAPSSLSATTGEGGVRLTWSAPLFPPPVTGYQVRRAADEAFTDEVTLVTSGRRTAYEDTTAQAGRSYYYSVRTESAAGWSTWSPPVEADGP
jgi:hypothetical protein